MLVALLCLAMPQLASAVPVLQSLSVSPTTVDLHGVGADVTVTAHITDDTSALTAASCTVGYPAFWVKDSEAGVSLSLANGTAFDGVYTGTATLAADAPLGTWGVIQAALSDSDGFVFINGPGLVFDVVDTGPLPAPTISGFSPSFGLVGTSVTLTGSDLTGATAVSFHGTAATNFTVDSATQITAIVPAGATSGTIAVTTPDGSATSSGTFTVTVPTPTISGFSPASGPVGTAVTLIGTNFGGASAVRFNGVAAKFAVNSTTQITATVPPGASTGKIAARTSGGTATSATSFMVIAVTPKLTLKLSGLRSDALKLGKRVTAKGTMTPTSLAGSKVTLTVQKKGAKWVNVKTARDYQHGRRLHLEVQARQEGHLPRQGHDRQDGDTRGRHDEVADVQGEVV